MYILDPLRALEYEFAPAALEELTQRCVNPVRRYMIWQPDVRFGARQFGRFKTAMQELVREVCPMESSQIYSCKMAVRAHS